MTAKGDNYGKCVKAWVFVCSVCGRLHVFFKPCPGLPLYRATAALEAEGAGWQKIGTEWYCWRCADNHDSDSVRTATTVAAGDGQDAGDDSERGGAGGGEAT